jgi:hypothetical protein
MCVCVDICICTALVMPNGEEEATIREQIVEAYDTGYSSLERNMHLSLHRVTSAVDAGTCSQMHAPLLFQVTLTYTRSFLTLAVPF